MLVRLMYASRAAEGLDADALHEILKQSRAGNPAAGITGLLCHCPSSHVFLQALEGGREPVNRLYRKLLGDERHHDVVLLSYEEIAERRFAGWSMGQVNMSRLNPGLVLKYSETPRLEPHAMSARVAAALFDELIATASIMGPA